MYLERLEIDTINQKVLRKKLQNAFGYSKTVNSLAREGNDGLKDGDPYTCCLCQNVFNTLWNLKLHIAKAHCRTKKWSCDHCAKFFFTRFEIAHHLLVHRQKQYCCNICDFKTAFKQCFRRHRKHVFKKCNTCGEVLRGSRNLKKYNWV